MNYNFLIYTLLIVFAFTSCNTNSETNDELKTVHFSGTDIVKQTIEYKNGKKNGFFKEYYRNGILKAKQFYVNDSINDTSLFYHDDGKLKSIQIYKNKLKNGCWRNYNKKGLLISEIFFKNNVFDSTCSEFSYRSAKLLKKIRYKEGLKNGIEETYYPTGEIQSKVNYDMGDVMIGTEEWKKNGKKINNDFNISIIENDDVLLKGTLTYHIKLENPKESDKVYYVFKPCVGNKVGDISPLKKQGDVFIYEYQIPKGGFVMEKLTIAAFRKTGFGNTYIKTKSFNVASNNY